VIYIDSSAIVKLVIDEAESGALRDWLAEMLDPLVSSALAKVEVRQACRRIPDATTAQGADLGAIQALLAINIVPLSDGIIDTAATLNLPGLRSLDALHLASALAIQQDIRMLVTYDDRLGRAASASGFAVVAPGT